jgi:site-specific DNA recombinase
MTKRALIYARVSYDDRKNESRNLEGQVEDGQAHCQEKGHRIVAELAEDDRGASGANWDLPMLNQALDMARAGEFDVLVTRELDRFARGLAKQLVVESEFKRLGVDVEYTDATYPDTPEGQLNKNIRAVIAEFEREKINQRMTRGRRNVVRGGRVMLHGNAAPYGYKVEESRDGLGRLTDKWLVIHEPEARIVRLVFDWYVYGDEDGKPLAINAIATKLTEMKVPTWTDVHGSPFERKRGYGEWGYSAVSKMLNNETYAGVWHYGKRGRSTTNDKVNWLALEVPAIVSRGVWEEAQERRAYNKRMTKRNVKYEYRLRGRVTCGFCGSRMIGRMEKGKYFYYYCPRACNRHVGESCENKYHKARLVDQETWKWVRGLMLKPEQLRRKLEEEQARLAQQSEHLANRLAVVDDLLAKNRREWEGLMSAFFADVPEEVLTERKARLKTTREALEAEWAELAAQLERETITDDQIISLERYAHRMYWDLDATECDGQEGEILDDLDVRVRLVTRTGGGWRG